MQSISEKIDKALSEVNAYWIRQDWADRELDEFCCLHEGIEIRLYIPNGGILGVSIWLVSRRWGWAIVTIAMPEHDSAWYLDQDRHVALAKAAISVIKEYAIAPKGRRNPVKVSPGQLSIFSGLAQGDVDEF